MTIQRFHRTVFYYENNEYLMKYTGTVSIVPKGAVALAYSPCFFLKPQYDSPSHLHVRIIPGSPARASYHKQSGFCPTRVGGGGPHSNLFSLALGWLDTESWSTALKETHLLFHICNRRKLWLAYVHL
jgi:hypothetical protein